MKYFLHVQKSFKCFGKNLEVRLENKFPWITLIRFKFAQTMKPSAIGLDIWSITEFISFFCLFVSLNDVTFKLPHLKSFSVENHSIWIETYHQWAFKVCFAVIKLKSFYENSSWAKNNQFWGNITLRFPPPHVDWTRLKAKKGSKVVLNYAFWTFTSHVMSLSCLKSDRRKQRNRKQNKKLILWSALLVSACKSVKMKTIKGFFLSPTFDSLSFSQH